MNLSEKLAAAVDGDEEEVPPAGAAKAARPAAKARTRRPTERTASDEAWSTSKRKVQLMVLSEVAPGSADLPPDELRTKVRSKVNEILEREDIGISPIERQRFVDEMLEDSLGYGPIEALLGDGTISEIMCNSFDEISGGAPGPDLQERRGLQLTRAIPPDH